MPLDNYLVETPHTARIFPKTSNGTYPSDSVGDTLPGHLMTRTSRASVEAGVIMSDVLAVWKFPTSRRTDLKVGDRLLCEGYFWQVEGPIETHNAVGLIQFCETVLRRVDQ